MEKSKRMFGEDGEKYGLAPTTLHPTLAMKGDDYGKKHALLKEAGCRCDLFSDRKSTAHQKIQWPIHR